MRVASGLWAALTALLLLPMASAHIALTVTAPSSPMPVGMTTDVAVDGGAECSDIFVGPPPVQSVDRTFALADDTPKGMNWTGDTVTWDAANCVNADDPGSSHSSGFIHLTPSGALPAFVDLPFEVVCDECEDGGFTAQVGYAASVAAPTLAAVPVGTPFTVNLTVTANYDTDLMVAVGKPGAHVSLTGLMATVAVDSPLKENKTTRVATLHLQSTGAAPGWTTDGVDLAVQPMARGKSDMGPATTVHLSFRNAAAGNGTASKSASGTGTGSSKKSPDASPLLAISLVAVAVAVTRRRFA